MKAKAVSQVAGESDSQPQQDTMPVQFAIVRKDQFALMPKATAKAAELELIKRLIEAIRRL